MTTKTAGPRKLPPPAGMTRSRGGRFWRSSVTEYVFTAAELLILEEICRLLNEIDAIRKVMAAEGSLVVLGSRGQPRPSQWLAELRGHRKLLGELVRSLALPDLEESDHSKRRSSSARDLANARWHR